MLVCASPECAKPFHRACLDPPPQPSAEKTWLCPDCDDDACAVCGGAGDLVLCDDCLRAWHLHCSVPVLDAVPEGDWTCVQCREEFAHGDLEALDLAPSRETSSDYPEGSGAHNYPALPVLHLFYCKDFGQTPIQTLIFGISTRLNLNLLQYHDSADHKRPPKTH